MTVLSAQPEQRSEDESPWQPIPEVTVIGPPIAPQA